MSIISKDISKAITLLNNNELVAIPTETVYGLAGNIYSEEAIRLIFETKQRPLFNPLIVHIPNTKQLKNIVSYIPKKASLLAEAFWPGPLTLVLPKHKNIPELITAGKNTVAVRIPNHELTIELLKKLDYPLAAPSANPFNRISPTKAKHVASYFKEKIKMVLDGGSCQRGIESTIIGFDGEAPIVYRLGATSIEAIESVVGAVKVINKKEQAPEAPGMLAKHYAPRTKTILSTSITESIKEHSGKRIGVLSYGSKIEKVGITAHISLSDKNCLKEAASKLYHALHELDQQNLDLIIAERLPDHDLGKSINDRLSRATA